MALSKGFRLNSATTPLDFRLAQQGGLFRNASGSPRQGILHSGSADGNIITRSASALSVTLLDQVVLALTRNTAGTDGVDILTNVGALVQNVTAPTANSWYAVFWARQNDGGTGGAGDPDSLPTFGVTYGGAAASPAIPATPTGATKIGHMLIPSTATTAQSSGVVYTETIPHTCLVGGRIRYRTAAEQTNDIANLNDGAVGFVRSGDLYFLKGGVWKNVSPSGFFHGRSSQQGANSGVTYAFNGFARQSDSTDDGFVTANAGTAVTVGPGQYVVSAKVNLVGRPTTTQRSFISLFVGGEEFRNGNSQEDNLVTSTSFSVALGATTTVGLSVFQGTGGTVQATGDLRVMKVG